MAFTAKKSRRYGDDERLVFIGAPEGTCDNPNYGYLFAVVNKKSTPLKVIEYAHTGGQVQSPMLYSKKDLRTFLKPLKLDEDWCAPAGFVTGTMQDTIKSYLEANLAEFSAYNTEQVEKAANARVKPVSTLLDVEADDVEEEIEPISKKSKTHSKLYLLDWRCPKLQQSAKSRLASHGDDLKLAVGSGRPLSTFRPPCLTLAPLPPRIDARTRQEGRGFSCGQRTL
jgi:hypothetical protein